MKKKKIIRNKLKREITKKQKFKEIWKKEEEKKKKIDIIEIKKKNKQKRKTCKRDGYSVERKREKE